MRIGKMVWPACCLVVVLVAGGGRSVAETVERDVVIYGGTSAGIVAGIQALAMGKTAVVIEPTGRVGGLTTGGLGQTDIGNKGAIGGLSREFYRRIAAHYEGPENWKWQKREEYRDSGQTRTAAGEETMWTFEPSAALAVYGAWIDEVGLEVIHGERLDRSIGVDVEGARIIEIQMESGLAFRGAMFIDATYEGDLMAAAGVSYTVGREANAEYGETLNGVQVKNARHHQFVAGVDPYVVAGDPASGLLPFLDPDGPGEEGAGDGRVQAYCFRMCLTDHPENRIPFEKPEGYDERWFELLLRNFEAGERGMPWINSPMPNRKTDTNNRTGFSTDFIGQNYGYPEASYEEREEIVARHLMYQQGLMWTLANHPRVPDAIRNEVARWGMSKDEFVGGGGWQEQLYIREARRMVGELVMTQHHCQGRQLAESSVGMAAYTMDSHHVQRHVDGAGHARNEGDVQVGGFPPYPIGYGSMVPRRGECENLLVPVCLSASHIAFGSIRMEPVFMVMAQSAATAAALAIDAGVPVQDVPYEELRERLLADGQVLEHVGGAGRVAPSYVALGDIEGIVVDDSEAVLEGEWTKTILAEGVHEGYVHDGDARDGEARASFMAELPEAGEYEVEVAWTAHANRSTRVPVRVIHAGGEEVLRLNMRRAPEGGAFGKLGRFRFGGGGKVVLSNEGTDGYVIADAVRWVRVGGECGSGSRPACP